MCTHVHSKEYFWASKRGGRLIRCSTKPAVILHSFLFPSAATIFTANFSDPTAPSILLT